MSLAERLVNILCDPERREELAGDLAELSRRRAARMGAMRARIRQGVDVLSVCVRQSRFRAIDSRVFAVGVAAGALLVALPHGSRPDRLSFNVNASDPAGAFTLRVEDGRVVSATMDGVPLGADRLRQRGNELVIVRGNGDRDFAIELRPGGVRWQARAPRERPRAGPGVRLASEFQP